jgi:hypothetical protein
MAEKDTAFIHEMLDSQLVSSSGLETKQFEPKFCCGMDDN